MSPVMRRVRGHLLRLVRRRLVSMGIGLLLMLPVAWLQLSGRSGVWWVDGLSLVVGATGAALFWTGLTGAAPDWVE
jgi:hypothetical protein